MRPTPPWICALAAAAIAGCAGTERRPGTAAGAAEEGLWIGPIRLCRGSVESASPVRGPDGSAALLLTMRPEAGERFAALTARRVGKTLAIRLDGRTLSEPLINEPILGGTVHISGLPGDVEAAARAAGAPC